MSESAFRRASAGATVFGIAVCPPAGAAAAQLAGGGTAAAASAGAVDTLVSVIPQIIGIEAAAEMLAQAGKAMLSKPPDGGDAAGGEEEGVYIENIKDTRRIYDPSIKHDPQAGWGSENPIPDQETGQKLLDSAYSLSKNKQLYNIYNGKIIKFQPDGTSGNWHAYQVKNTSTEVPVDVYKQMMKEKVIDKKVYNKLIHNNWH